MLCGVIPRIKSDQHPSNWLLAVSVNSQFSPAMSRSAAKAVDILVVGGGIVGNAFVSGLLRKTKAKDVLKIGIVDLKPPPSLDECMAMEKPDPRVYALSPRSIQALNDIGVWEQIQSRAQPYSRMVVWEQASEEHVEFNASSLSVKHLGMIAEDKVIHASLCDHLKQYELNTVEFVYGAAVDKIRFTPSSCEVSLKHPNNESSVFSAKLILGADGSNSVVRRISGLSQWGWGYGQDALVATVKVDSQQVTAWQKYLETGPLAVLPLWSQYSSIVWSLPSLEAQRLKSLSDDDFKAALNEALQRPSQSLPFPLRRFFGESKRIVAPLIESIESPRLSFPLQFQNAKAYVGRRVALLGDAAHSIHPQAGQGLNLGIQDADTLSSVLAQGLATGQDLGDTLLLSKYGERQYLANIAMMGSVDAIHSVFSSNMAHVQVLRALGLRAFDNLHVVKNQVAKFAMGFR